MQIPIDRLVEDDDPVIGVWATTYRERRGSPSDDGSL